MKLSATVRIVSDCINHAEGCGQLRRVEIQPSASANPRSVYRLTSCCGQCGQFMSLEVVHMRVCKGSFRNHNPTLRTVRTPRGRP